MSELLDNLNQIERNVLSRQATAEELIESICVLYHVIPKHREMLLSIGRGDAQALAASMKMTKELYKLIDPQSAVSKPSLPKTDKPFIGKP